MAHTPGPWHCESKQIRGAEAGLIATVGGDFYDDGKRDSSGWTFDPPLDTAANAKLIAAAPELLAALRDAVDFIRGSNECLGPAVSSSDREWIDYCVRLQSSCEQAIAKAEGRSE